MKFIIILIFSVYTTLCEANFIPVPTQSLPSPNWSGMYLAPNELRIQNLESIYTLAPSGVYLTVGTERAFMGVALADEASHLLVIDLDPKVIDYNLTTQALLVASRSPEEFVALKFWSHFFKWEDAKHTLISRGYRDLALALSKRHYDNYRKAFLQGYGQKLNPKYTDLFFSNENKNSKYNYHQNAFSFLKLKSMAEGGRMQFVLGDLKDIYFSLRIFAALQSEKLKISVFDISNLNDLYIPKFVLAETLLWAQKVSHPNTLFVGTFQFPFESYFYTSSWVENLETQPDAIKLLSYLDLISAVHAESQFLGRSYEMGTEKKSQMNRIELALNITEFKKDNLELTPIIFKMSCTKYFKN